jgi:hypothetical protein
MIAFIMVLPPSRGEETMNDRPIKSVQAPGRQVAQRLIGLTARVDPM